MPFKVLSFLMLLSTVVSFFLESGKFISDILPKDITAAEVTGFMNRFRFMV